jgi:NTE family protein
MATKNTFFTLKNSKIISLIFLLSACQTQPVLAPKDPVIHMPTTQNETVQKNANQESVSVPEFVGNRAPQVGLIFGPGGAKTLAQIGVLQELEKQKIPVVATSGLEWGAIVSALFALNGQGHEVDWKISQLPKFSFSSKNLFSQKMRAAEKKDFDVYLQKVFANTKLENLKVPFACPFLRNPSGRVSLATKGAAKSALRACWYYPPIFSAEDNLAAPFALAEAVEFVKSQGAELIVLINVLDSVDKKQFVGWADDQWNWLAWSPVLNSLKNARLFGVHEVITIDTSTYSMSDISQRLRLIQLGQQGSAGSIDKIIKKYDF